MIFTALIAKFLSAGAVAQAATGATVAVVAFTGVGAVGALPDPVQDTFATVVATVTTLEAPTSDETTDQVLPEVPVAEEIETTTGEATEVPGDAELVEAQFQAWAIDGPVDGQSISAWASEGSKEDVKAWLRDRGMTFGNVVSAHASGKGFSDEELLALGAKPEKLTEAPIESDTDVVVEDEPETQQAEVASTEDRGSRGNGNGNANGSNGKGKGNGKN